MPEPLELPCNPARSQSWTDVYNSEANGGERLIEVPDSRFSYRSHSTPRHLDCLEDASIQRSDLFVRDKVAATLSPPSSKARTPLSPATAPSTIQRTPRKNPKSHPLLRLYSHPSTSYKPIFPPELTQANRQRKSRRNAYRKLSCWSLAHGQNPYYRLKRKRGQDASCTVQATAHFKPIPARKLPRKHTAKHVFSHHKGAPTSSSSPLAPSSSWHLLPFFSSSDAYNSVRNPSGANSSSIPHGGPNPTASGPSVFNTRVLRTQIRKGVSFTANIVGEAVRVSDLRGVPKAPRVPPGALDLSTAAIRLLEDRAQSMAASSLPPKIHDGWLDFTSSTPHIPASLPDEHLHESPAPSSWHPITEPPNTSVRVSPVPVDNKLSFLLHEDQDAASDKVPGSSLMPHEQASLVRPHDDGLVLGFDETSIMKLGFIILTYISVSLTHARPQHSVSQERLARVSKEAFTHFGPFKDYKSFGIPSIKGFFDEPDNKHPHKFNSTNDGSGNYYFGFSSFGLKRYEIGELKNVGTDDEIQTVRGQYQERYVNEDGVHVVRTIGYVADENGYRPFLISISFVLSTAVPDSKKGISSAALGSLIGGNALG